MTVDDVSTASIDAPGLADRYQVLGEIGRGGSARVVRARDRRLGRDVAVKILPFDVDAVAARRRRHEVELLATLRHPTLVSLLDTVTDDHATYLVMELMEGGTLRDRIRAGAMPLPDVRAIAVDAARALDHIHARGIVHRDVKPANLLLPGAGTPGPVVKLADFGIARLLDIQATRSTGVIGTANYLSPEQAEGRVAGPASDVYSLGLTLLEASTGRTVFPGSIAESVAARLVRDPEVPSWLGPEWRALLTAMVQRDPAARPTSAEVERRAALLPDAPTDDATQELVLTAPLPVGTAPRARRFGSRSLAAAAAVLLVAGTGVALAVAGSPAPAAIGAAPQAAVGTASPASTPSSSATAAAAATSTATSASTTTAGSTTAYRASDVRRTASSSGSRAASAPAAARPAPAEAPAPAKAAEPRPAAKAPGHGGAPKPGKGRGAGGPAHGGGPGKG